MPPERPRIRKSSFHPSLISPSPFFLPHLANLVQVLHKVQGKMLQPSVMPAQHAHEIDIPSLPYKRRRERIQAKLKLLRELIPNSQKLDTASLLDQAISRINALKFELQMMQEMSQFSYANVPAYYMQFTGAPPMSPFVLPNRSNIMITDMNSHFTTTHQPLYMPFSPRFPALVAKNIIPMSFLPPN